MKSIEALKRIETVFSFNREGKANVYKSVNSSFEPYYEDFDCVMEDLLLLQKLREEAKENEI